MIKKVLFFCLLILVFIAFLPAGSKAASVYQVDLAGTINNAEFAFLDSALTEAEAAGAELIILKINSLGGYVDPALKIRDRIFKLDVPIVTFVSGRAWSAAALIALAGERMYVAPGSSIGAAETRPQEEKYISALRKEFSATAEKRGKNKMIAEAMVDADLSIPDLIAADKLLTLTAAEALRTGIADAEAVDLQNVINQESLAEMELITIKKSNWEKIIAILSTPYLSGLILIIAFSALIFEVLTPGFAVGGTIGSLALLLFFAIHIATGSISVGIIALFVLGILLIMAEVFIIPGFGVAGISGIVAIALSLFYIFPNPTIALNVMAVVAVFTILFAVVIFKKFGSSRLWGNIALQTDSSSYFSSSNKKELLHRKGHAITDLRPAGIIEVDQEKVDVISEGGFIEKGQLVKIIAVNGSKIKVRKIEEEE